MSLYYYLLSGLKEFHLNDQNKTIDLQLICNHILEQLSARDRVLFNYLIYQNDNKNLSLIISRNANLYCPYDDYISPSIFDGVVLEHPNAIFSELPLYIQSFLENNRDTNWTSIAHIENTLLHAFYDEIQKLDNTFLSEYFSFFIDLKNIITAANLRLLGFSNEEIRKNLIGSSIFVEVIAKSAANDFGIAKEYSYITKILDAIEGKDPYAIEKAEMDIVFNYLDNKSSSMFFRLENVFVYYIKCFYINRLSNRDAKEGQEAIKILISDMKKELDNLKV